MKRRRQGIFYGWWIVTAGAVNWIFAGTTYIYGLGVFYKTLIDHFGWTRAQLAGAVSLSRLETGLLGGIGGFLVDRFGPRPMLLVGTIFISLGFILLSRINSLLEFYLYFICLVAAGQSLSCQISIDTTVANWFIRRRGMAFGLLKGALGLGAAGVVLLSWFIARYGWRTGFLVTGIVTFIIGVPVAFVMRRRPEYYGLSPDGDTPLPVKAVEPGGSSLSASEIKDVEDLGMTVHEALRNWSFWAISLGFGIRYSTTTAVTLHAISLIEDLGYSRVTAASVLSSIGMVSLIGRLGGGALNDLIGTRRVAVASTCSLAISFLILSYAQNLWQIALFVAIYAPSYGCSAATSPAIKGDYFGRKSFGAILGLTGIIQTGGSMFGPVFAGYVYDVTKSYHTAFLVFAGVLLVAAALLFSLKSPRYSKF